MMDRIDHLIALEKAALAASEFFRRQVRVLQHNTKRNQVARDKARLVWMELARKANSQ